MVDMEEMLTMAMFSTQVGSPGYMAPELYERKQYGMSVDVFAMGIVFLGLVNFDPGKPFTPLYIIHS